MQDSLGPGGGHTVSALSSYQEGRSTQPDSHSEAYFLKWCLLLEELGPWAKCEMESGDGLAQLLCPLELTLQKGPLPLDYESGPLWAQPPGCCCGFKNVPGIPWPDDTYNKIRKTSYT